MRRPYKAKRNSFKQTIELIRRFIHDFFCPICWKEIKWDVKDEVLRRVFFAGERIKIIAERFGLEKESIEASREAFGKLPYLPFEQQAHP